MDIVIETWVLPNTIKMFSCIWWFTEIQYTDWHRKMMGSAVSKIICLCMRQVVEAPLKHIYCWPNSRAPLWQLVNHSFQTLANQSGQPCRKKFQRNGYVNIVDFPRWGWAQQMQHYSPSTPSMGLDLKGQVFLTGLLSSVSSHSQHGTCE